jgi:hypothetical protein
MTHTKTMAGRWVRKLLARNQGRPPLSYTQVADLEGLAEAAFALYKRSWGKRSDITAWEWPFNTLAEGGDFNGAEPWAVLFREAVALYGAWRAPK